MWQQKVSEHPLNKTKPKRHHVSSFPRGGDTGIGTGSKGTFVLSLPRSHDKTSQMLVPTNSPPSSARDLVAVRCHNRAPWGQWVVFVVVQIAIAFTFKPDWQFYPYLGEQMILNIQFVINCCATFLHVRTWEGFPNFPVHMSTPRKDSSGLQPHLSPDETQDFFTKDMYVGKQQQRGTVSLPREVCCWVSQKPSSAWDWDMALAEKALQPLLIS